MSLLLGIDLETTGFSAENACVTEIGAVLYDSETNVPLKILNELVYTEEHIPERITTLTKITDDMIQSYGLPLPDVIDRLNWMSEKADYVVIHNAAFDLRFLKALNEAFEIHCLKLPVIDTMKDLPLDPMEHPSVKLPFLAASHGFLNPFAHRAVFDVLTMLRILSNYDVDKIYQRSISPVYRLVAQVGFSEKDLAKEAGFKWDASTKQWFKEIKECDYVQEDQNYKFPVNMIKES